MERISHKKYLYKTVSLFSGIGGFDLAFLNAGFNLIWSNDFDKYACETFKKNISENIVCSDINEEIYSIPEHDVLIGGFPCQPFSTLGNLKGFEDERGTLFFTIKKIISLYSPKVVVLENVKNLVNHNKGKTFEKIKKDLVKLGYRVYYKIHNTADFGIPQRRNRIYIVCFKKEYFKNSNFNFPIKKKLNMTAFELLDKEVDEKYFISKKILPTILGKGTKGYIVNPTINQNICKTLTATMHKMHRASQDNYYIDEHNYKKCGSNKSNIRKLTPNECRKLQGFPSDWIQVVSDTQAYKQFGNAVTVDVAYEIAVNIKKFIKNNKINW